MNALHCVNTLMMNMIRLLYTFLLLLVSPFLLFGLFRTRPGKPAVGNRWKEHLGFTPPMKQMPRIWLHAVSVGEVIAAKPLVQQLLSTYPDDVILLTTTTPTGAQLVSQLGERVVHRYMPIDFSFAVKRFLTRFQPEILLIMETELWPNTLATVHQHSIPIVVLNARLSERSKRRYAYVQPFFASLSSYLTQIVCQFDADADRFKALGVSAEKVTVSGSIKFDLPRFDITQPEVMALTVMLEQRPVWIAASSHEGEDAILLAAHQTLLNIQPNALLILVPRHPERFDAVASLVKTSPFSLARRSRKERVTPATQVYLGDTLGEMMLLFAVADVAMMGGSLLGEKVGGHNLLEPASLAKPLITGSSFYNFQPIGEALIAVGACQVCDSSDAISEALITLFSDPPLREQKGRAALGVVEKNRGAVAKSLVLIQRVLEEEASNKTG